MPFGFDAFYSEVAELVRDWLYGDEGFQAVHISTFNDRNIVEQTTHALQGTLAGPTNKVGMSMLIACSAGGRPLTEIPGMFNMDNMLLVTLFEIPMYNLDFTRTDVIGVKGVDVVAGAVATIKRFQSSEPAWDGLHFRDGNPPMDFPEIDADTGLVVHRARLLFTGGLDDLTQMVEKPVIEVIALNRNITITCATPSASIYYTTDGTRPLFFGVGNPNNVGTLYTGTFDGSAFDIIWARGFRPEWRASLIAIASVKPVILEEGGGEILDESGAPLRAE